MVVRAACIPDYKVNKAFNVDEDTQLEEVQQQTDGATPPWYLMFYMMNPKTNVPDYADHLVIKEPFAP